MIPSRPLALTPCVFGALLLMTGSFLAALPFESAALAQDLSISVQIAPPVLPVYDQPPMPELGDIWTPGYWSYADGGYYWVPGTWVEPPEANLLWTPPYWGWEDGGFRFHAGYWGNHVGYYGGVNYGHGYGGDGYQGGRWENGHFAYNRSGNNFGSVHVTNVYQERMVVNNRSHVSYAGGAGGLTTRPTETQRAAEQEHHAPATAAQNRHIEAAAAHPGLAASHENGRPAIAATARPAQFEGKGVVPPRPVAAVVHATPEPKARPEAPQPEARPAPAAVHEPARNAEQRPQPHPEQHAEPHEEKRPQ
jgi:hypothetical protein